MKNTVIIYIFGLTILKGQFSYPAEDFLGGGIGYSPMYIKLDSIPGASYLTNIGLNPNEFDDPFVVHGGEGFAHVTGRWRIGGYAGMGGTSVSTIPEIKIFVDGNGNDSLDIGETSKMYTDELNPSIKAKFTFLLGAASVEYVMPLLQDLEISSYISQETRCRQIRDDSRKNVTIIEREGITDFSMWTIECIVGHRCGSTWYPH